MQQRTGNQNMKKIIVIGCPGSGKSTFSKKLNNITGLPLFHLDMMFWNEDRTTVEKDVFLDRLSATLKKSEWIIDGNYASSTTRLLSALFYGVFSYLSYHYYHGIPPQKREYQFL